MIFRQSIPILYSEDINRSIDYYTQVLRFEHQWKWDEPPTFGGVSKDLVEIYFCKGAQGHPGTWLSLMVDNVDEYHEILKTTGATIRAIPQTMEWGVREMLVEDPDGHMIRFAQGVGRDRDKSGQLPEGIEILDRRPTIMEYQQLTAAVKWEAKEDRQIEKILSATLFSAVALHSATGEVVGCVLLIGDNVSFYYIKDMMVDPRWQNKHIGTALMKKVNDWLNSNAEHDALAALYTGENLAPFYRQFGFKDTFGMSRKVKRLL